MEKLKIKELIKFVEDLNPYSEDVYPEPTQNDWHRIGEFLQEHGKNPDRIFAKWGRMVWKNCVSCMKDFGDDK